MAGVGWFDYPQRRIRFFAGQIPPLDLVGDLGTDEQNQWPENLLQLLPVTTAWRNRAAAANVPAWALQAYVERDNMVAAEFNVLGWQVLYNLPVQGGGFAI